MPDEQEKSIRETLEAAFEAEEEKDDGEHQQPEVQETVGADAEGDGPDEGAQQPETTAESGAAEESEQGSEPKFLPPEGSEQEEGSGDREQPVEPEERVPVAWRGAAKEVWDKVPPEARQEVLRRENQINDALRESAESRQFLEQFQRTVAPYQQYWVAEGSDPLTATRNLMQTAAGLRSGTPQQKAQIVAQIVNQFGVDIEALDGALVNGGTAPVNGGAGLGPDVQNYLNQQLAPVNQFMQGLQQRAQQQEQEQQRSVAQEIDAFEQDPKYVYYEDVRDEMADILELAGRRGQEMSLEQAYDKAVAMDPKLSELARKRQDAERARQNSQTLQQKKRAAASLETGTPIPAAPKQPKDVRGAIEMAWEKHSSGGV